MAADCAREIYWQDSQSCGHGPGKLEKIFNILGLIAQALKRVNIVCIDTTALEGCNHWFPLPLLWKLNSFLLVRTEISQIRAEWTLSVYLLCSFRVFVRAWERYYNSVYICTNAVRASPAARQTQCVSSGGHHMLQPGARLLDPAGLARLSRGVHLHHSLDWRKLTSLENFNQVKRHASESY